MISAPFSPITANFICVYSNIYTRKVEAMKKIIGTMVGFYILVFWILPNFHNAFFNHLGSIEWTFLQPVYSGMIVLSGIIVACTLIILEELETFKKHENNNLGSDNNDEQS